MKNLSRREFFTFCKKDVLKDAVHTWHNFNSEMKKQEELPFEEEMFKIFGKQSGKRFLKKNQSSL